MSDRHVLSWNASAASEVVLPPPIRRNYIHSPNGRLELLVAQPSTFSKPRKKALLFLHGGFGCAAVWIPFMLYFSQTHGYPCYAISLRGHGTSWNPGFLRMVFATGKGSMAQDLGYAVNWVQGFEAGQRDGNFNSEDIVLIGHSAGGGLSQYFLARGLGQVGGLVLVAAFPNFGGLGVYWNWAKMDPYFGLRMCFRDFGHPRSPLSSTTLVHHAFFSPGCLKANVRKFELNMPEYESLLWPLGMMFPFVKVQDVLRNVIGWGSTIKQRILIVVGSKDPLMNAALMQRMAEQYKKGIATLISRKCSKLDPSSTNMQDSSVVGIVTVKGAGHHIQNDLQWEDGALQILTFIKQL